MAKVRVAGVEVGSVTSVRVRPEVRDHPAEVTMSLYTPYVLKIPADSVVTLETEGVLGEVFPQIHIQDASGPALPNGGMLSTRESEGPTAQQWAECLSNLVDRKPCDFHAKPAPGNSSGAAPARR